MTAWRAIGLVMRRELRARLLSKTFVVSLAVIVGLIVVVTGLTRVFGGDDAVRIGLVGPQPTDAVEGLTALADAAEVEIEVVPVDDRTAAELLVTDGELDGAVVDGRELLMRRSSEKLITLATAAWGQAALVDGLRDVGLSDTEIGAALTAAEPLEVVEIDTDPDADAREAIAFATVILMFVSIQITGGYIMLGIFEEKTTRVVELVLSSIPARHLLAGKILGIGILGLIQVVVLAGAALVTGTVSGSSIGPALDPALLASAVVWFVLGYLLYGAVFAAGASLAPRQEDAQATLAPVTMILLVSYLSVIATADDPSGLGASVVSWVPVTAPFAMPGRIAANEAAWWEVLGSLVVTAAAVGVVLLLAERIYVRSVLHTDRKIGWREAWSLQN